MNALSIVIPTHNRAASLKQTLQSIAALSPLPEGCETIVVANACTDETESVVEAAVSAFPMPLRLVRESRANLNIARNAGTKVAGGEVVALIDDDVKLNPGWADALLACYRTTGAGIVAGRVDLWFDAVARPDWMNEGMSGLLSRTFHGDDDKQLFDAGNVVGANLSYRRSVWETTGGFREGLDRSGKLLTGGGDVEFVRRAMASGHTLYYSNGARLLHWVAPERVTPEYLVRVAYGNGLSQVFIKPRMSLPASIRCVVGHAWLVGSGMAQRVSGALSANFEKKMTGRLHMAVGRGGLRAIWKRLAGQAMVH